MARRRPQQRARIEPPEWWRNFHPEAWDVPDAHELAMIDGSLTGLHWPEIADGSPGWLEFRDMHARRRWGEAKYAYEREHPEFAEQVFDDIVSGRSERFSSS